MVVSALREGVRMCSSSVPFAKGFFLRAGLPLVPLSAGAAIRGLAGLMLPVLRKRSWEVLIFMTEVGEDIFLGGNIIVARARGRLVAVFPVPFSCRRGVLIEIVAVFGVILEGPAVGGRTVFAMRSGAIVRWTCILFFESVCKASALLLKNVPPALSQFFLP